MPSSSSPFENTPASVSKASVRPAKTARKWRASWALSGLAVAAFPLAKNTGLAHTFATAADRVRVRQVLAVLCAMLAVGLTALGGWALVLAAGCVFARYYVVAKKQFGGVTGDLAGWFLQKCEIWMLAALAACQWWGML